MGTKSEMSTLWEKADRPRKWTKVAHVPESVLYPLPAVAKITGS
jgi:hypothetical protein